MYGAVPLLACSTRLPGDVVMKYKAEKKSSQKRWIGSNHF
jgi:hypothetical protein